MQRLRRRVTADPSGRHLRDNMLANRTVGWYRPNYHNYLLSIAAAEAGQLEGWRRVWRVDPGASEESLRVRAGAGTEGKGGELT